MLAPSASTTHGAAALWVVLGVIDAFDRLHDRSVPMARAIRLAGTAQQHNTTQTDNFYFHHASDRAVVGHLGPFPVLLAPTRSGLTDVQLNTVSRAIIFAEVTLCNPSLVWSSYCRTDRTINAYNIYRTPCLKRTFKYGFCSELFSISDWAGDADLTLFSNTMKKQHCLHAILPAHSSLDSTQQGHIHDLLRCSLQSYIKDHVYVDVCSNSFCLHCIL